MGFVSKDAIKKALSNGRGQRWAGVKSGTLTPEAAGHWVTHYPEVGSPGSGTAAGGAWSALTDATGCVTFSAVSPKKRYLARAGAMATQNGTLLAYDRLGHIGSISLTTTGSKGVSASLPARYSGAETDDLANIEAWVEVTTVTATSIATIRLNTYTNEVGVGSRLGGSLVLPATATNQGWMSPLPLQAGDKGVSAIANLEVVAAATGGGVVNVVLLRRLVEIPLIANVATLFTEDELDLPRIYDGSSINFAFLATAASAVSLPSVRLVAAFEE